MQQAHQSEGDPAEQALHAEVLGEARLVGAQQGAGEVGEGVDAVGVDREQPQFHEVAQELREHLGVRAGPFGRRRGGAASFSHQVGDAEGGGHADGVGLEEVGHVEEGLGVCAAVGHSPGLPVVEVRGSMGTGPGSGAGTVPGSQVRARGPGAGGGP
ncbi:hypothetical protein AVW11_08350 [Streptomyces amritsarensis]|uniref:Uncharacterized protein n=1 Tax=Streptomyces amritsarensis TaxID=681158 RepID=A0ABX3G5X4_9ACTN|nr:hypothetical protein AVW11_08350 [Streptomyces amritsarensis]